MNKSITDIINHSLDESFPDPDLFETVTLRPGESVSAMIASLNELLRHPVSTMFVDEISQFLYQRILQGADNQFLLQDLVDAPPQPGSALDLLIQAGAIREAG